MPYLGPPTLENVFAYLDMVRSSGRVNMLEPFIIVASFGVQRQQAAEMFKAWVQSFGLADDPKERALLYRAEQLKKVLLGGD